MSLKEVTEGLQEAIEKIGHGSAKGLEKALLFIANESQKKAPVELGDLRGSVEVDIDGKTIANGVSGGGITILSETPGEGTVGRVSFNEPYAAVQHERVDFKHPMGGQAKYLETVLNNEQDTIIRMIADGAITELEEG